MADRYWVGGTGTWNGTNTTNWAATSNGSGGQSVPTSADDVFFDANSGTGTVTVVTTRPCRNLNFTGFAGTFAGSAIVQPSGSIILATTTTWTYTGDIYLAATTTGQTIDTKGVTLNSAILIGVSGVGGEWILQSNLTTLKNLLHYNGTFDGNGYNVTFTSYSLQAGTKTIKLGSGTWTASSAVNAWNALTNNAGFTVVPGTATISLTSASAKNFLGGGFTWPTLDQGGAGALTISGNNTFQNITNTYNLVAATTITFTAGSTQTVTRFGAYGSGNKALTLNSSTPGTKFNLVATRGTIDVSYCRISDSSVSGGARWQAYNTQGNVNVSGNVGWNFVRRSARTFMKLRVKSI